MSQADKYEPGGEPTKTRGTRHAGASATGSNPGPNVRPKPAKEDAVQGTTSELPPKAPPGEGPRAEKPHRGTREVGDT